MNAPLAQPKLPRYRPLNWRRRVLIGLLAVATAFAVVATLLNPPGGVKRTRPAGAASTACTEDVQTRCPGGKTDVILVPPAHAAQP